MLPADGQLAGTPSIVFDAVAVIVNNSAAARLAKDGAACDFVRHAFGHLKAIAYSEDAKPLLEACGIKEAQRDEGVVPAGEVEPFIAAASTRAVGPRGQGARAGVSGLLQATRVQDGVTVRQGSSMSEGKAVNRTATVAMAIAPRAKRRSKSASSSRRWFA